METPPVSRPSGYSELLSDLRGQVRAARAKSVQTVSTQQIGLYWTIGHGNLVQQDHQGWGSGVIKRLAEDLRM